jgi:hypothetical protein
MLFWHITTNSHNPGEVVYACTCVAMKFPEWFYCKHTCILTERDHFQSTPLEQLHTLPNNAATVGNICVNSCYGTAFSAIVTPFSFSFIILKSLPLWSRLYVWKQPEVVQSQNRGIVWVFYFSSQLLGQKLLDREHFVSWSFVMVENPILTKSSSLIYCLSKFSCTAIVLIFKRLSAPDTSLFQHFHQLSEILDNHFFHLPCSHKPFLTSLCHSETLDFSPISFRKHFTSVSCTIS